ncbi:phage holin family protein [Falsibacillus pallidus]|uniref:Holin family Hol44 protein (Superfamily V) n=1 Tax=Falsibacillus pallidus TaxID=493781 RepID=A0A370GRL2_9BACI|nr:phage holin family protein [Falsibacillus pallidus]RDI45886.1 holin family Hol44 protein (superfamily V) [Falsibacillus pallidus]
MNVFHYIMDEALILIPVLMVIGKIIKNTPKIKNWVIPYILLVLGVVFAGLIMGFSMDSFFQGVLVAGTSVFGHQIVKQTIEKVN